MRDSIPPARLRQLRDSVLRYVYDHGADMPYYSVPADQIERGLGITRDDLSSVVMVMMNQGLLPDRGIGGTIGLSDRGQREAEALGPAVLMRDPPHQSPGTVHIHANYSVVQVAGANSSQSAALSFDNSQLGSILSEIEQALPRLDVSESEKKEAVGLLSSLRSALVSKVGDAGMRAIGGALGSILIAAGSPLGQRLMEALRITIS